ncbi:LAFE_0G09098g1_1 [Lachancea fermentati]|uniref:LAFE_0G09098g1_1 n=1 Tax=Lachancea fermentati TaxID=4955 RepID=A0A1G4MHK3_LACFM|nr:LAFE_0G09098g1_1 [Lachancea fermentati]
MVKDLNLLSPDKLSCRIYHTIITRKLMVYVVILEMCFCCWLIWASIKNGMYPAIVAIILNGIPIIFVSGFGANRLEQTLIMTRINKLYFLREVVVMRPGLEMEKWDRIAKKLNPVFFENSSWASRNFFLDGKSCEARFRYYFVNPYLKRKRSELTLTTNELDPFIEEAVKAYQESLHESWKQMIKEQTIRPKSN